MNKIEKKKKIKCENLLSINKVEKKIEAKTCFQLIELKK